MYDYTAAPSPSYSGADEQLGRYYSSKGPASDISSSRHSDDWFEASQEYLRSATDTIRARQTIDRKSRAEPHARRERAPVFDNETCPKTSSRDPKAGIRINYGQTNCPRDQYDARNRPLREYPNEVSVDKPCNFVRYDDYTEKHILANDKEWYLDKSVARRNEMNDQLLLSSDMKADEETHPSNSEMRFDERVQLQNPIGNANVTPAARYDKSDGGYCWPCNDSNGNENAAVQVTSYGILNKQNRAVVVAGLNGKRDSFENGLSATPGHCHCKAAGFALVLVLVVVIFAVICGLLLYFNYVNFRPRLAVTEVSCERLACSCAEGAACARVCGSDGRSYGSECELRRAACTQRALITVMYDGECEIADPCRGVECWHGATCRASPDGRSAECRCPAACPSYGDHAASRPVCASDGRDHANVCEMRRAACEARVNLTVKFIGKCDPCADVDCAEPEICQLDDRRQPACRCAEPCPLEFSPVCSSDGKTYADECQMRREACRSRKELRVIYRGQCSSGVNPCEGISCLAEQECSIDRFGIARCACAPACEAVVRPACGTDGRSYDSACELRRAACLAGSRVQLAHHGLCGAATECAGRACPHGAVCETAGGRAACRCPRCPAEFAPVCGSDGISYGNRCKLTLEACQHRREVTVLYEGPCNGCENKKCEHYAMCESDGVSEARCVCPAQCADEAESGEVCGSDGETYSSACALRATSCRDKRQITMLYKGSCDLCKDVQCAWGGRCEAGECVCPTDCAGAAAEPVCANTMQTFASECELQRAACERPHPPLLVTFYGDCTERFGVVGISSPASTAIPKVTGPSNEIISGSTELVSNAEPCADIHCDYEATCELGPDNFPRCSCLFDCASVAFSGLSKPVCASDLRLYPSMCHMKLEACQRQEELRLRPLDLCQGQEVKPCQGEAPIIDTFTGIELDCGNGPHRKDCPAGSYCHQTTKVARCCKKDKVQEEKKGCEDSWFGCCGDGVTPAQGPDLAGCPSQCNCNKLGSFSESCDPDTQQCYCRPGVGGLKCDRCEPGYWGLPKISSGHQGCIPCGCSMFGSVREDCEQMTGRCVCRPGIQGQKCTICTNHELTLGPNGCFNAALMNLPPSTCNDLRCYFGAVCSERGGMAVCECPDIKCPPESMDTLMVCGSDGQTYVSDCHLKVQACRTQTDIVVQAFGICREDAFITDRPIRPYTQHFYTQSVNANQHYAKSTRHIVMGASKHYRDSEKLPKVFTSNKQEIPTDRPPFLETNIVAKDAVSPKDSLWSSLTGGHEPIYWLRHSTYVPNMVIGLIGDTCLDHIDCIIKHTICSEDECVCSMGYVPSKNRRKCLLLTSKQIPQAITCTTESPCGDDRTCSEVNEGLICICKTNRDRTSCVYQLSSNYQYAPSFNGDSFIIMRPLSAYHTLSIDLTLTSYSNNGVILYNQQNQDGRGDFVSLAIINGHIELRYNLGDGIVSMKTAECIERGRHHKISVRRYHKDGLLKLDDFAHVIGKSKGKLKFLDLMDNTFIGFPPIKNNSRFHANIGTRKGLVGCIHWLEIGRRQIIPPTRRTHDIYTMGNIRECADGPCDRTTCGSDDSSPSAEYHSYNCDCS